MITVKLLGEKELLEAFKGVPRQLTDTTIQKANVKASQPMVFRMHRLAPVGLTGDLADSIGSVKAGKNNKGELGAVQTGPRRKGGYKGFTGHLHEFGTKRRRTRSGANRGKMKVNPFVETSFQQTIGQVRDRQAEEIANVVGSYLRRTVKR